ncbi:MAG: helix-turn-helix transcriptional regulator [Clostridia bacterium]|nr:helix-turn-helix transcriptional regulator [Clostridia bacterium]
MEKKTIGSFISALRRAKGWTQRDLAEQLNVSDKAVSRWERDESAPDLSLLPLIADLFGITVDELLRGQRRPSEPAPTQADEASAQDEDARLRAEQSAQKRQRMLLGNHLRRYKNLNYISLGLALGGMIAALICNFGFNRAALGFFLGIAFEIAAVICTLVFTGNALSVVEEDYDHTLLSSYKRDVLQAAWRSLFLVVLLTGPLILLLIIGISYGAYVGAAAATFFPWSAVWLVFGGLALREIGLLFILPRVFRAQGVVLSEDEWARNRACVRLLRRCSLSLVLALLLPLIAFGVLDCGMIDPRTAFADGTVFEDFEEFRAYIEQTGDPNADRLSSISMSYYGNKGTVRPARDAYDYEEGADGSGTERVPTNESFFYSEDQEVVTEVPAPEEGDDYFKWKYDNEYVVYDRSNGSEVTRFAWNNPEVCAIRWDFRESTDGTPIEVLTLSDRYESERIYYAIHTALFLLMIVETAAVLGVYIVKRRRIGKGI